MSEQVKRYDAVHIRYEDNNIRYGEGCEVEVVTAADYEREVRIAIAAGQRMQDKYDALHAEASANARATDTADRFAGFVAERQAEWIGLFSQAGAAKLCKAAGLRVTKRAGHLPTKGSLLTAFDRLGADKQSKAIADLFDQLLPEDFES